ncbi:MAG: 8-amino-7-oxononanoate synthase [Sandaracinus sp.]|nr:8-amino-7-oxononanoate synthase [Sandaracinus sp.]MCB9618019.1 8-amino-7-oxononanoate synthase [Sandaracinus sp.]MCB9622246.1 8-amino-7-oxononanoate synthase [Sandaracinus sp.]
MSLDDHLRSRLHARREAGLLRVLRPLEDVGPTVRHEGRDFLNFSSNDYLGLAAEPALRDALREATAAGAPASRLIVGHLKAHEEVEAALAALVARPASLLFSSGYAANVGTVPALVGPEDLILSDELNHASLIDGCRLSRAKVRIFPHADLEALERLLRDRPAAGRVLVVTDAVFSMDGDRAPLRALAELCQTHGAWLYVDEAHTVGVYGPAGAGLCAELGVEPDVLVGTLGKAFGVAGAFVAGSSALREWLLNVARSFVYSTAYPAALLPVLRAAIRQVRAADDRRAQLHAHATRLRTGLRALGFESPGDSPIVPWILGSNEAALTTSAKLADEGILGLAIRPPTVPVGTARLRLTPMATHTSSHLDQVLEAARRIER